MAKLLSKTEIDKNIIMHVKEVEDIRFKCNALSSMHVGDVEDLKILTM